MSHHLDCELSRRDSRLDITDLLVFPGERGTVFVMDVNSSFARPGAQPGFHPEGRYEFKIHMDEMAVEELTYRVTFGERDQTGEQAVALHVLTGPDARDDAATGDLLAEGRTHSVISGPDDLRLWAGRARDSFYVDLTQVRAINTAVKNGAKIELPGWGPNAAKSSFAGTTIHAIVLELAGQDSRLNAGRDIGVWATTKMATDSGGWQQINREGHPMMWPIFRPDDSEYAGDANKTHPTDEVGVESEHIARLVAGVVAANGTSDDPVAHGESVVRRLLPDVLPYRTGTRADFGFAEHNGRTRADNAPEVMFSLVLNSAISTGLTPEQFADTRSSQFPYSVEEPAIAK